MTDRHSTGVADDALVGRAQSGDRLAFGQLVRRNDEAMRRLAFRLLGNQSAMDDVLQDAYLKAFRSIGQFDGRSRFSTWLYTITYRCCLDHLRDSSDHDLSRRDDQARFDRRHPPPR